jgi:hypothetical protein
MEMKSVGAKLGAVRLLFQANGVANIWHEEMRLFDEAIRIIENSAALNKFDDMMAEAQEIADAERWEAETEASNR